MRTLKKIIGNEILCVLRVNNLLLLFCVFIFFSIAAKENMGHIDGTNKLKGFARPAFTSELAFNSVVPWSNEIHRRHGEAIHPCNDAMDFHASVFRSLGAVTRVCIGTSTFWCTSSLLQFHSNYFDRNICPVNKRTHFIDIVYR